MRKFIKNLDFGSASACAFFAALGGAVCALMMCAIVVDVLGRYLFNSPIQGVGTVVIVFTPVVFAMGLGYAQVSGTHIRVKFFVSRFKPGQQRVINKVVLVLNILIVALVTWLVAGNALESWSLKEFETGFVRIPVYPTKILICFGFALWCLQCIVDFLHFKPLSKRGD